MQRPRTNADARRAFTLIELLVVVAIIAITAAISFGFIGSLASSSRVTTTVNRINGALSVARSYATAAREAESYNGTSGVLSVRDDGDGYSGAAVLITPSNEIRLIQNVVFAADGANPPVPLELYGPGLVYNGYDFIGSPDPLALPVPGDTASKRRQPEVDDARFPDGVAVFGITMGEPGSADARDFVLLPPPFAIRFDTLGRIGLVEDYTLSPTTTTFANDKAQQKRFLYYDGDRDGVYDVNLDRSNTGGYHEGGDTIGDYGRDPAERFIGDEDGRIMLPFDRIEPVIGVLV
ncbi:MAG: prepilin-type N-terminal cleavage/methylation domain-containing protein, partial [Planctomycetota bacterium]